MLMLVACSTLVSRTTGGLAANLNAAMLNQDDPEMVRDGAPAYLLMLDSLVEGSPDDAVMLGAAAELYAAYGVIFVDDPVRAKRLTQRARRYGIRALCAQNEAGCGATELHPADFESRLQRFEAEDVSALYSFGLSWLAYIQAHRDDALAVAGLPQGQAAMERVAALNFRYRPADVAHRLAVLSTLRPPALGGDFETGREQFERAINLSDGKSLAIKVDFAKYYAKALYDRELHDRLLSEVLEADPEVEGHTLLNTLAQEEAAELMAAADAYF